MLESHFIKVTGIRVCSFIKKGTNTGVFLWLLQNFQEHLFYRTPTVAVSESKSINISKTYYFFCVKLLLLNGGKWIDFYKI